MNADPVREARKLFIQGIYDLHNELADAIHEESLDTRELLRLTACGVDSCMVALATILEDRDL